MPTPAADTFEFEVQRELARLRALAGLPPPRPSTVATANLGWPGPWSPSRIVPAAPATWEPSPPSPSPLQPPTRGAQPTAYPPVSVRQPAVLNNMGFVDEKRAAKAAYAAELRAQMEEVAARKRAEKEAARQADAEWLARAAQLPSANPRSEGRRFEQPAAQPPPPPLPQLPSTDFQHAARSPTTSPAREAAAAPSFNRYRAGVLPPDELARLEERARGRASHAEELGRQVQERRARKEAEAAEGAAREREEEARLRRDRLEMERRAADDAGGGRGTFVVSSDGEKAAHSMQGGPSGKGGGEWQPHVTSTMTRRVRQKMEEMQAWAAQHHPTPQPQQQQQGRLFGALDAADIYASHDDLRSAPPSPSYSNVGAALLPPAAWSAGPPTGLTPAAAAAAAAAMQRRHQEEHAAMLASFSAAVGGGPPPHHPYYAAPLFATDPNLYLYAGIGATGGDGGGDNAAVLARLRAATNALYPAPAARATFPTSAPARSSVSSVPPAWYGVAGVARAGPAAYPAAYPRVADWGADSEALYPAASHTAPPSYYLRDAERDTEAELQQQHSQSFQPGIDWVGRGRPLTVGLARASPSSSVPPAAQLPTIAAGGAYFRDAAAAPASSSFAALAEQSLESSTELMFEGSAEHPPARAAFTASAAARRQQHRLGDAGGALPSLPSLPTPAATAASILVAGGVRASVHEWREVPPVVEAPLASGAAAISDRGASLGPAVHINHRDSSVGDLFLAGRGTGVQQQPLLLHPHHVGGAPPFQQQQQQQRIGSAGLTFDYSSGTVPQAAPPLGGLPAPLSAAPRGAVTAPASSLHPFPGLDVVHIRTHAAPSPGRNATAPAGRRGSIVSVGGIFGDVPMERSVAEVGLSPPRDGRSGGRRNLAELVEEIEGQQTAWEQRQHQDDAADASWDALRRPGVSHPSSAAIVAVFSASGAAPTAISALMRQQQQQQQQQRWESPGGVPLEEGSATTAGSSLPAPPSWGGGVGSSGRAILHHPSLPDGEDSSAPRFFRESSLRVSGPPPAAVAPVPSSVSEPADIAPLGGGRPTNPPRGTLNISVAEIQEALHVGDNQPQRPPSAQQQQQQQLYIVPSHPPPASTLSAAPDGAGRGDGVHQPPPPPDADPYANDTFDAADYSSTYAGSERRLDVGGGGGEDAGGEGSVVVHEGEGEGAGGEVAGHDGHADYRVQPGPTHYYDDEGIGGGELGSWGGRDATDAGVVNSGDVGGSGGSGGLTGESDEYSGDKFDDDTAVEEEQVEGGGPPQEDHDAAPATDDVTSHDQQHQRPPPFYVHQHQQQQHQQQLEQQQYEQQQEYQQQFQQQQFEQQKLEQQQLEQQQQRQQQDEYEYEQQLHQPQHLQHQHEVPTENEYEAQHEPVLERQQQQQHQQQQQSEYDQQQHFEYDQQQLGLQQRDMHAQQQEPFESESEQQQQQQRQPESSHASEATSAALFSDGTALTAPAPSIETSFRSTSRGGRPGNSGGDGGGSGLFIASSGSSAPGLQQQHQERHLESSADAHASTAAAEGAVRAESHPLPHRPATSDTTASSASVMAYNGALRSQSAALGVLGSSHRTTTASTTAATSSHSWGLSPDDVALHKRRLMAFYTVHAPAKARADGVASAWSLFGPRIWDELERKYGGSTVGFRPGAAGGAEKDPGDAESGEII